MEYLNMPTITATDAETGEYFQFSYDPKTGTYQIDGIDVIRKRFLESEEDVYVFGSHTATPTERYHIARQQFEQLLAVPDLPQNRYSGPFG